MDKSFDPTFQIDTSNIKKHSKSAKKAAGDAVDYTVGLGDKIKGIFTSKKNKDEVKNTAEKSGKKFSTLSNKLFSEKGGNGKSGGGLTIREAFGSKTDKMEKIARAEQNDKHNISKSERNLNVTISDGKGGRREDKKRDSRNQHSESRKQPSSNGGRRASVKVAGYPASYNEGTVNSSYSGSSSGGRTQVQPGPGLQGYPNRRYSIQDK